MSRAFLILLAVAGLFVGAQMRADQTNSNSPMPNADAVNAFLQVQAQLHETQMMLETNRQETVAALEHNAEALNLDIQLLQKDQRANEAESARGVEQMMLWLAIA